MLSETSFDTLLVNDTAIRRNIFIKGARSNNLKNIDLIIPKNQLVVITGVSGSGKSSISMDTLFAEGQRRYVESLSSYARQFLMRMKKPDVDYIKGVCPAIAIEQKVTTGNNRSTVGSMTETYDFMRLLYARIGKTISPISGMEVKKHQVSDVVDFIQSQEEGTRVQLFTPLPTKYNDRTLETELNLLLQKGYTRVWQNGKLMSIEDVLVGVENFEHSSNRVQNFEHSSNGVENFEPLLKNNLNIFSGADIRILIDRFIVKKEDSDSIKRIGDSVQTAFYESEGEAIVSCQLSVVSGQSNEKLTTQTFNNRYELDGITFIEPTPQLFNYNNSLGACPVCEGYGKTIGIDEDKVVPNKMLSVFDGAIACWKGEKSSEWLNDFLSVAHKFNFPVHTPYQNLTKDERRLLWKGSKFFDGIDKFFKNLEANTYKIQNRVMLARYRGRTTCPSCEGKRLRPEALYIKINNTDIADLTEMPIDELHDFFENLVLNPNDAIIAKRLLLEINNRLRFMRNVGLSYLTLNRVSSTLSGGETQRINLTRTLGSNLTSSMYILDEPSVGLHPRDTARLVTVLKHLRDLGNTVVVVEHEEEIIKNADYLIDMGPEAGIYGGEVVFAGPFNKIFSTAAESLTTKYMTGVMSIPTPTVRRTSARWLQLNGCSMHNLKNVSIKMPLNTFIVVSGVSGSGKTTLIKQILYPALQQILSRDENKEIRNEKKNDEENSLLSTLNSQLSLLSGDTKTLTSVEMVNQSPIGKSSRSNPATYVKAYDDIRDLFSKQHLSKIRGYKPGTFSFNTDGGRCDTCKGEGETIVEMQFLADVHLVCEECNGKRFKAETLEVTYKNKNISEVLELSIDAALEFFGDEKNILQKIKPLSDVGLGYVQLGQSSSTLSGGEAQRVKLASFLGKERAREHIFFIFDEPTTGLHFHDIKKLLDALNALVEKGHTVLVVEHNMEVIKCADWLIDLGPEGGKNGGYLVYEGVPEGLVKVENSYTGQFLKGKL